MFKKISKNILVFALLAGGFFIFHSVRAQGFGVNEVNSGLAGSLGTEDPRAMAGRIINISLGFLGVIAVGLISYAGFLWMMAKGEEEKIETAKKILKSGIIGLAIILASWGIASFILMKLGEATGVSGGGGCANGDTRACGCAGTGSITCTSGTWGACLGADPEACGSIGEGPTSCDSSASAGCQATPAICDPGKYCDPGDCACKPKGNLGQSCSSDPSGGVCKPDNSRCGQYLSCSPDTCTCYGTPIITEISPAGGFCHENSNRACTKDSDCLTVCDLTTPNGAVDNFLTIFGKNFGEYSATSSKVVFAAGSSSIKGIEPASLNPACVNTWRDDQIVIAVPGGNVSGPIAVENKDGSDSTSDDVGPKISDFQANAIVRPGLCYLNPNRGALSSAVGYQGINLYSSDAYFGNYVKNVKALDSLFNNAAGLSGTSTIPNIKSGDSGSFVLNNINGQTEKSNYLRFIKESETGDGPYISYFYPTSGNTGQYVTIHGSGFGGARGLSRVYFGDKEAIYDFPAECSGSVWKNDQIIVKVPADLSDGYQTIKIVIGSASIDTEKLNPNAFEYDKNQDLKSSLCKIKPERGEAGTPVSLWGEYFGTAGREGLIKFNYDVSATGTIAKDGRADKIQTTVPTEAISGPVRVITKGTWGNELNFAVGTCQADEDCGTQICCPAATYKAGRCVDNLAACSIDVPNSVFEWSFNTGLKPTNYSCSGLAKYFGSCQAGATCPNVPGSCSSNPGGSMKAIADCDFSCASFPGCGVAGRDCQYDPAIDKCVLKETLGTCGLEKTIHYTLNGVEGTAVATCNMETAAWEISLKTSCPEGWVKGTGDRCISDLGSCGICPEGLQCLNTGVSDTFGRCGSPKMCPTGGTCTKNFQGGKDQCVITEQATCDCCCTIGRDSDCCAPLKCEGTCGADTGKTTGATLGRCGGCASAGSDAESRDAACNCSGHSGQFCDTNNSRFPDGVCTDCSNLDPSDCTDHSSACCLDAHKSTDATDDFCRGGNGLALTRDKSNPNFGYCGYFKCENLVAPAGDPLKCASTTPFKIGDYASIGDCTAGCLKGDPCKGIASKDQCQAHSGCCFDGKATGADKCRSGAAISGSANPDAGYCAYYDCAFPGGSAAGTCASTTPVKTGAFNNIDKCDKECANPPSGPGLSCSGKTSLCSSEVCNFPNFACFSETGSLGGLGDCGSCCCQPGAATDYCADKGLKCEPNRGNCSGGNRGLCCGCSSDAQCGYAGAVGCGADTCCQARPLITHTSPAHLDDKVCRNSSLRVDFNTLMDIGSLNDNVLLLEEHDYGTGVCPAGTFVARGASLEEIVAQRDRSWLARLADRLASAWRSWSGNISNRALAGVPDSSKLYCAVSGTVSSVTAASTTSLIFSPQDALAPSTNYYLIVKGDEELNSQSGVLSAAEIGFNGPGYANDASLSSYTEGEIIKFNGHDYKNSQIIKFTTLSGQSSSAGFCTIDHVGVAPSSYLFKTTDNSLTENDGDYYDRTFDTAADGDKLLAVNAYSADGQTLHPVTGYYWDWKYSINDTSLANFGNIPGLPDNTVFVAAQKGVIDGATELSAAVDMSRFRGDSCTSGNCSCIGRGCLNDCCNAYSGGDELTGRSSLYVFLCANPWPPVNPSGEWSPWIDNCAGATDPGCRNYDYKFYYCRDAGGAGTADDLPAIINQAVTLTDLNSGALNLICSSDRSSCSQVNQLCGPDANGDHQPDGLCVWSVLKESYFFREGLPAGGQITEAVDQKTGGAVKVDWRSDAAQADSYEIYYLKSGSGKMQSKAVKAAEACRKSGTLNICSAIITGLTDGTAYVFKVAVISANKAVSQLSEEKTATPTDESIPEKPQGLSAAVVDPQLKFTWIKNADATLFYRLYHGTASGQYGESFDSLVGAASLTLPVDQFRSGLHYFALTAVKSKTRESDKTEEIVLQGRGNEIIIGDEKYTVPAR